MSDEMNVSFQEMQVKHMELSREYADERSWSVFCSVSAAFVFVMISVNLCVNHPSRTLVSVILLLIMAVVVALAFLVNDRSDCVRYSLESLEGDMRKNAGKNNPVLSGYAEVVG